MQYLGHTCSKNDLFVYLKFNFSWMAHILSGIPTTGAQGSIVTYEVTLVVCQSGVWDRGSRFLIRCSFHWLGPLPEPPLTLRVYHQAQGFPHGPPLTLLVPYQARLAVLRPLKVHSWGPYRHPQAQPSPRLWGNGPLLGGNPRDLEFLAWGFSLAMAPSSTWNPAP